MMVLSIRSISFFLLATYLQVVQVKAADCTVAIVGSPFSDCFDIYTNAKITQDQFDSYNPGLNCSLLQLGQRVCVSPGGLPSLSPTPQPNGTCAEYTTVSGDFCSSIATKFSITVAQIESFNLNTYKWKGCGTLQVGFTLCVSTGQPPPIPINPLLQCGPESAGNKTCPLRACCSAFGFCGTTIDFCTTTGANPCISNCIIPTLPSCSTSQPLRSIGYYAGWGNRRVNCPDSNVSPDQLDFKGYTHAHFAFATISQGLAIQVTSDDDVLLRQLVAQKARYSGLKVLIAVGGWDFSELDATKDLFTFMIASSTSRATFINSVKAFLITYALDGIDIDFEYPGATERSAPAEDTPNLTAFFSELKTGLPSTAIISIATPAGYWFLRGFEIDKIAASVTYINMMSYDYHGQWDTNITGQAPVTNPHTSILDMQDSVLLYVRAGIDMSKVNLGLAWYGRTYQLADPTCSGYNCTMVEGGAAGLCSGTIGYLSQFEISTLLAKGATPTLDNSTQTYWLDNAGDLITFDQTNTWNAKSTFAAQTCFGGTFVWSLDQIIPPVSPPVSSPEQLTPCSLVQGWTSNWRSTIMSKYYTALYLSVGMGCGCFGAPQGWQEPVLFEAIINYAWANGLSLDDYLLPFSPYLSLEYGASVLEFGGGHDDALWAALGWLKYYEYPFEVKNKKGINYLGYIKSMIDFAGHARTKNGTELCPGGVFWQDDTTSGKNTITNALYIHASAKYFLHTGDTAYRDQAIDVWNWAKSVGIRNDQFFYNDGTTKNCTNNKDVIWTYNQGVMISAAGQLALADPANAGSYISWAQQTINAVLHHPTQLENNGILTEGHCDLSNSCNDDELSFKGIFMMHLQYFLDAVNDPAISSQYASWIGYQARSIFDIAQNSNGDVGNVWSAKAGQNYGPQIIGMAISAGNLAAKYGAHNGSFTC